MSHEDIARLQTEESELLARLEAIRREKAAKIQEENERLLKEKRERELSEPVVVRMTEVYEALDGTVLVTTEARYREDVVAAMQTIPSRVYGGSKRNRFDLQDLPLLLEKLSTLKNVEIEYAEGIEERIRLLANKPVWLVELADRWLHATPSPRAQKYKLYTIPGAEYDTQRQRYKVPLTEAYNVWDRLSDVEGVVWTDEAKAFVLAQLERRAKLDTIATLTEDPEYAAFDLNGMRLRPFQTVGARFIETADGKALLGDEMGLGKTWQAIAYAQKMGFKKIVVIAPASLKPNWFREILKLTGQRAKVFYGLSPTKHDMLELVPVDANYNWFIFNYDIVGSRIKEPEKTRQTEEGWLVTDPEKERFLWAELITMARPDLVIVDEGHYIKNLDSNRSKAVRSIQAPRFVFMTGTPILNRPGELWPMLTKIAPEQFPAYETFLNQYTFDGKVPKNTKDLEAILRSIMIRRLKRDVYADLPKVDRRPIYHELSAKAVKAYKRVLAGIYDLVEDYHPGAAGASREVTNILAQIQRLKMVVAIDKAQRTAELAEELYDQTDESEHRKVIIFTQYKGVAHKIAKLLGKDALSFVERRGSEFITVDANERDRLVQRFQTEPDIRYLVVTEKTTKEGHNITAAGHVIFNDLFWTPAGHDQAIGRAYGRISDMHGVDAYFMIGTLADNGESIEEWIWQLLGFKQGIIDEVVEGVESSRNASVAMQLIEKVRESMGAARR